MPDTRRSEPWSEMKQCYPLLACFCDLLLGLSLGLYYTITYYGRALLPLPGFVALGAPLMYYVAVDERFSTVYQAWLWMICFPLTGLVWRLTLSFLPRLLRQPGPTFAAVSARLWHVARPLLLPLPLLAWLVASPAGHCAWSDFIAVCLRRHNVADPGWLAPVMMALAVLALGLEIRGLWQLFSPSRPRLQTLALLTIVFLVFLLAAIVIGFGLLNLTRLLPDSLSAANPAYPPSC